MASIAKALINRTRKLWGVVLLLSVCALSFGAPKSGNALEDMSLERWAKLREVERFQLNAAEKLYREMQYKAAADEYEKYMKLYEKSEAASFAQLKWAHCHIHQRKLNTAIKDGYQTVLDYFPDSPEAPLAALLIGRTSKDMGDLKASKKAYAKAISTYPKHYVAILARVDLVEVAGKEKDTNRRAELLRELTFDVDRKGPAGSECVHASKLYAQHCFSTGDFEAGMKALLTSCTEDELPGQLMEPRQGRLSGAIRELITSNDPATKQRGEKLADAAAAWFKTRAASLMPSKKIQATTCWYAAAEVQASAGRPEKQKEVFEQMLVALGTSDTLLGHLAQWYKENNQRDRAREMYAKFKDTTDGQAHIAASFVEEKKFDRAVDIYRTLAAKDEKGGTKWMALVASTFRRAGKMDQAIAVYRDLLTSDASHAANWHWEIGETYFQFSKWKDAITTFRGTDRFPQNYERMADAHRHLKQWDEAISLYQQIMVALPNHASKALMEIAHTQEQADRKDAAIKSFKQICDKYPKSSEGSRAHAHLNLKYKITVTLGGAKD